MILTMFLCLIERNYLIVLHKNWLVIVMKVLLSVFDLWCFMVKMCRPLE